MFLDGVHCLQLYVGRQTLFAFAQAAPLNCYITGLCLLFCNIFVILYKHKWLTMVSLSKNCYAQDLDLSQSQNLLSLATQVSNINFQSSRKTFYI